MHPSTTSDRSVSLSNKMPITTLAAAGLVLLLLQVTQVNTAIAHCSVPDPHHYPVLRLLYAVNSTTCIDPGSQTGTILAIVECSYVGPSSISALQIMKNPRNSDGEMLYQVVHHLNISRGYSITDLYYVVLNKPDNRIHSHSMQISCYSSECQDIAEYTSVPVTFCTQDSATAIPYFVTVPRRWKVKVPASSRHFSSRPESTDIALFNAITVASSEVNLTCIGSITLNQLVWTLNLTLENGSVVWDQSRFLTKQVSLDIPFYIKDNFLYFNTSKARETGLEDLYRVVLTASGKEPWMVGMVLTGVSVTQETIFSSSTNDDARANGLINKARVPVLSPPTLKVSYTFSCPYAGSQPGQLLASITCFDNSQDNSAGAAPIVFPLTVYKQVRFSRRTAYWPTTEVNISLREDHEDHRLMYLTLEHVSSVDLLAEPQENTVPTYCVYAQCANSVSMVTHSQPITFCIKHDNLITEYDTDTGRFTYDTATPYFTNLPREMDLTIDPHIPCMMTLFNPKVSVYNTEVKSYSYVQADVTHQIEYGDTIIATKDLAFNVYSPSANISFITAWRTDGTCSGFLEDACSTTQLYTAVLVIPSVSIRDLPISYDLVIHASSPKSYTGSAEMLITVHLHEGNNTSYNSTTPFNCTNTAGFEMSLNLLPEDALEQILHITATKGTLLGAFRCSGTAGLKPPRITVSRTSTLTSEDNDNDIITYDIKTDRSNNSIHYWALEAAQLTGSQHFLISCENELSVFSERVLITVEAASQLSQPSFISVKGRYIVDVHEIAEDTPIFAIKVTGGDPSNAATELMKYTFEVVSLSTSDMPFYIGMNNELMVNRSRLNDLERGFRVYDVILTVRANVDGTTGVGRAYTRIKLIDGRALNLSEDLLETIASLSLTFPLVGVVLLTLLLLIWRRRWKRRHAAVWMRKESPKEVHLKIQIGEEWITEWRHVKLGNVIGEGQFGMVNRGMISWQGVPTARQKQYEQSTLIPIAIKFIKGSISSSDIKAFEDEINLMVKVSTCNNPHIIKLIGCITKQSPTAILTEFALYGNLCDYLRSCRHTGTDKESPDRAMYETFRPFEPSDLTSFAQQIASGMEYLSALSVIHRDLACRNVLVGEGKVLKIADFGLSKDTDVYVSTLSTKLPIRWMAPESIQDRVYTEKSDVWAYGVTLWEICTLGGFPYHDLSNKVLVDRVLQGYRMERPSNCTEEIYKIMESCWKQCPADRPTFCEINRRLSDLIEQNNNNESYISMLGGSEVPIGSAEEVEETLAVEETATVSWRAETDNAIASLARSDHS